MVEDVSLVKPRKVLFCIKGLESAPGGAERVITSLCSLFERRGYGIVLVTFDKAGAKSFYPLPQSVVWRKLDIGYVREKTTSIRFLRQIWALRRVIRDEKPDLAVGFMHSMYCPLAIATRGLRVPLIASEHTVPRYYENRRLEFLLVLASSLIASRVTVLSDAVMESFPPFVRRRMVAMSNPVNFRSRSAPAIRREKTNPGRPDGARVILSVGRMDENKDQLTLVDAFARLAPQFPDWTLRVVGDGVLRDRIIEKVRILGLESRVELPGVLNEVSVEYERADLFAMSSRYESFGLVTAEALAAGLPVVGFADCPGTNELVEHGRNGMLVSGADRSASLAEGLAALMRDPGLREELASRAPGSVSRFSPAQVADRWEDLMRDTMEG